MERSTYFVADPATHKNINSGANQLWCRSPKNKDLVCGMLWENKSIGGPRLHGSGGARRAGG